MTLPDLIQPLFDRILILEDEAPSTTEKGLVIPDALKERMTTGSVVLVGSGIVRDGVVTPLSVNKGDRVHFKVPSGSRLEIEGTTYLLLREGDIFGVEDPA
jgi:chaperonin GroES